jgi:mono/diheme cytochrome c family protein
LRHILAAAAVHAAPLLTLIGLALTAGANLSAAEPPAAAKGAAPEFDPAHAEKMKQGLDLFKSQVRQLLIEHCVECHGGAEVTSGLDLATRKGLLHGGAHGTAVVAGKPGDSNLVRLIRHQQKPYMPDGGVKLANEQIASIARWIELGAPYDQPLVENPRDPDSWTSTLVDAKAREFWSLRPLAAHETPQVKDVQWGHNIIDRFVLARLEEQRLSPNPTADRRTLLRRAYFDLIGLPPTPEETQKFLNDPDPQAYDKLIDRLLESPHFGERWARHWLDAARFAESHGFEQDYDRPYAYHYRDFVIEAFNQDMPYDQFVRWQLAGDEYEPENPLALKATGFLGAGVFPTQITANEVERTRYDALDDMAATTGSALLGLSIGCARCHDHKFDPIPQADYYRFISTFTTTVRSNIDVNLDPAGYAKAKAKFDAEHAPFVAAREKFEREELPARFAAWEQSTDLRSFTPSPWQILPVAEAKSKGNATLMPQSDGSVLASGENPEFDTYTITCKVASGEYTGVRLEALSHSSLVKGGPGRAANGNFALTDLKVVFKPTQGADQNLKLARPQATFEQTPQNLLVKFTIDGDKKSGWAVDPQFGQDHAAVYDLAEPLKVAEAGKLIITLDFQGNKQHQLGRPRISLTTQTAKPLSVEVGSLSAEVAVALNAPADRRTAKQIGLALKHYRQLDPQWQQLNRAEQEHLQQAPRPNLIKMMVCSEGVTPIRHHTQGADFFNETYFLKRGDCDQKMGVAAQGFLQALTFTPEAERHWLETPPPDATTSYRRRALAEWITDVDAGAGRLLARVIANRLWHHHFGHGIVGTPNDFGVQGERPTHPELLDYLAGELLSGGWRLKALHKQIMTSAAYRQASSFDAADERLDPQNRWLWRRTPHRVEAELIRDSMLAVSGLLDRTQFGPGTLDEGHKRRSIYFMIKRSKLVPMMQLFDQPEPLVSVGDRPSTTIAPQALALLNSPHVRGYAAGFAQRLLPAWQDSPEQAVKQGYLMAIARDPDRDELAAAAAFLESQTASYAADGKPAPRTLALTDFCQVLFGLNEFVYVD